jgi:hypothetical protein
VSLLLTLRKKYNEQATLLGILKHTTVKVTLYKISTVLITLCYSTFHILLAGQLLLFCECLSLRWKHQFDFDIEFNVSVTYK